MTESQDRELEEQEEAFLSADPMLEMLVSFAEKQDLGVGVTLTVRGLLISGNITSYQSYLEGIAQAFESTSDNLGQIIATAYRSASQGYQEALMKEGLEGLPHPQYIHLSNARFIFGNTIVPTEIGVYWRGRLDEVDGFSLGIVSPSA
jgi:hypothetical protein